MSPASLRPATAYSRFIDSMALDYERWREGIGYDLLALAQCSEEERRQIESLILPHAARDWRDVEALAALDTARARNALLDALEHGGAEIRSAVLRFAPELAEGKVRTAALVQAIRTADVYAGLTATLAEVEKHHPREVIDALLQGVLDAPRVAAGHYAGMLLYLHGKASEPFDWDHRPFLLQFATDDREQRKAPYQELLKRIGRTADL